MRSANKDHLFIPGIERFDPSFCDNCIVLKIDGQSFSPFRDPGMDDKFKYDKVVGLVLSFLSYEISFLLLTQFGQRVSQRVSFMIYIKNI